MLFMVPLMKSASNNRVLSADEILIIYAEGSRGKNNLLSAPVFTVQPASATVANGGTATFSASVKSVLPYSCQWYFNDTNAIAWATTSTLVLSNVSGADAGEYSLMASNDLGVAVSFQRNPHCAHQLAFLSWACCLVERREQRLGWLLPTTTAWNLAASPTGQAWSGNGFVFDGATGEIQIGNPTNLQLQTFTIEAWINRASESLRQWMALGMGGFSAMGLGGIWWHCATMARSS